MWSFARPCGSMVGARHGSRKRSHCRVPRDEDVQKFQIHGTCVPERCFKGPGGKGLVQCNYGFPFDPEEADRPDESGMRMPYRRRCEEDSRVVPYLAHLGAHVNIQRVTSGGWELYLAKYVTKAEPSFDLKLPQDKSESQRYLRNYGFGRLEVENNLLGFVVLYII